MRRRRHHHRVQLRARASSGDEERELEVRPDADRDRPDGGDSPAVNETPAQTPARSEVTAWPVQGSSRIAILTQGWGTGLARGALAFVAMAALGQVVAFAANLARSPGESAATAAKLGWLYFGWFHHAAVTTRVTSVEGVRVGGEAGLTANVGLAMMLGTFVAIAILYRGGASWRTGPRRCDGPSPPRDEGGARVCDPAFVVSGLMSIDIPIPRNRLVAGSLQMPAWGLSWFVLPLLIAAAAGAAGGLRSRRHELISHDPWGRRASGVMAGGLRMFVLGLVLSFAGLPGAGGDPPARPRPTSRRSPGHPPIGRP